MLLCLEKDGRLRLVIDARRANYHFQDQSHIELATGDSLGRLELEEGESSHIPSSGLEDAFYHLGMPEEWRPYFGLRAIRAGAVGLAHLNGSLIHLETLLHPRLFVILIGWSWAVYWCQHAVQRVLATQPSCSVPHRIVDGQAPPNSKSSHFLYVDNLIIIGSDQCSVQAANEEGKAALRSAGLEVHQEEYAASDILVIGWEFDRPAIFRPARKRVWRARLAIREILRISRISGRLLEQLIGHLRFISQGRREILSVLGSVFGFIQAQYLKPVHLWKSVRRELMLWDSMSPLIWTFPSPGAHQYMLLMPQSGALVFVLPSGLAQKCVR